MKAGCVAAELSDALQRVRETRFLIDRVDQWIYEEVQSFVGQRVLEVGCGRGNLLARLATRAELVVGIDHDLGSIQHVSKVFAGQPNVRARCVDICASEAMDLASHRFDTIVSLNVLEHIPDDALALRHMRALLCRGGNLVLVLPAHSALYGSMDAAIGHYRRYDRGSLNERLAEAQFEPINDKYLNVLGALGWLVNGRLLRRQTPPSGQLRLFNAVVPLVRGLERRLRPPLGVSLLSVSR